ncbi:MAG TPA: enolase C-terminal domain-like protein [Chthoniobacterales bacterium]
MIRVTNLHALEILDSRGRPTVAATMVLADGTTAMVSIPSGASTGKAEAKELRDGLKAYRGLGCRKAVASVCGPIARVVVNHEFLNQEDLDLTLKALDGTPDKSRLGANAILATSLAFARATAIHQGIELYNYFAALLPDGVPTLPRLSVNLFSGGKHAFGQVAIQDVLIVPSPGWSVAASLAAIYDVYQTAAEIIGKRYNATALTADEGGLAPPFQTSIEMLETAAESIESAGYKLGSELCLAVDVAASHFVQKDGSYRLDDRNFSAQELIDLLVLWRERLPLVSIEDGLSEDDWEQWPVLRKRLGEKTLTLADDLTCTNPDRIQRAIQLGAANALLLKVNQIGTITEAKNAYLLAREAGWKVAASARSGETEDNWLADLSVGWSSDFIKVGSITQSERLAKYNRLLMIEDTHAIFPIM